MKSQSYMIPFALAEILICVPMAWGHVGAPRCWCFSTCDRFCSRSTSRTKANAILAIAFILVTDMQRPTILQACSACEKAALAARFAQMAHMARAILLRLGLLAETSSLSSMILFQPVVPCGWH